MIVFICFNRSSFTLSLWVCFSLIQTLIGIHFHYGLPFTSFLWRDDAYISSLQYLSLYVGPCSHLSMPIILHSDCSNIVVFSSSFTYSKHASVPLLLCWSSLYFSFIPCANLFHTRSPQGAHLLQNRENLIISATWLVCVSVYELLCVSVHSKGFGWECAYVQSALCWLCASCLSPQKEWSSHSCSTFYVYNYRVHAEENVALNQRVLSMWVFVCACFWITGLSDTFSKYDTFNTSAVL